MDCARDCKKDVKKIDGMHSKTPPILYLYFKNLYTESYLKKKVKQITIMQ